MDRAGHELGLLSGYAGYFSFGHGAFFGAGMYTTATLTTRFSVPFLWTLLAAGLLAAALGAGIGAVVFRVKRLRGELFGLLTLAITFVLGTIVLNTRIDGGPGVFLSAVPLPRLLASPTGTIYLLGLALAVATVGAAYAIGRSRLGFGLFAIHDDEDVAEVEGVPTFRYKLAAFALSAGIAGVAGGIHAMYVGYVTVGETFSITVPLYVVLMSVLGGARHWLGPAVGATLIAGLALRLHRRPAGGAGPRRRRARPGPRDPAAARGRGARGAPSLAKLAAAPARDGDGAGAGDPRRSRP